MTNSSRFNMIRLLNELPRNDGDVRRCEIIDLTAASAHQH